MLGALGIVAVTVLGILLAQGKIVDVGGVTVPDVRTRTLQDAQDQLSALGLAAVSYTHLDVYKRQHHPAAGDAVEHRPDGQSAADRVHRDRPAGRCV